MKLGSPLRRAGRTPARIRAEILRHRRAGESYGAIASRLNARRVPTAFKGREWYASSVRAVERRAGDIGTTTAERAKRA